MVGLRATDTISDVFRVEERDVSHQNQSLLRIRLTVIKYIYYLTWTTTVATGYHHYVTEENDVTNRTIKSPNACNYNRRISLPQFFSRFFQYLTILKIININGTSTKVYRERRRSATEFLRINNNVRTKPKCKT